MLRPGIVLFELMLYIANVSAFINKEDGVIFMIKRDFRNIFFLIPLLIVLTGGVPYIVKSETTNESKGINSVKTPNIHFEEEKYDIGEVEPDETIKHVYYFTNTGDERLVISDIKTICKCISFKTSSKEIQPGETGEIEVILDPGKESGKIWKIILVHSNDPARPVIRLKLRGFVKREVVAFPPYVYLPNFSKDKPSTRELYLLKGKNKDFTVLKIEADSEYISFDDPVPASQWNKEGYKINVTLKAAVPIGKFGGMLRIYTDSKEYQVVEVPVYTTVKGELSIKPGSISIIFVSGKVDSVKPAKLTSNISEKLFITNIKHNLEEYITTSVISIKDGHEYEIIATPIKDIPQKIIRGVIHVETDYEKQPVIKVPVLIYSKKQI